MRRTMAGLAMGLLALVLATAARAVPVQTTTQLNLRAGPGVSYAIVATMPPGEVVDMRGCRGTWCFVVYRGSLGWASGRYLARIPVRPRTRPRFPLLDLFDPQAAPGPRYEAPPPPAAAPPRVIERPAPRPEPQRRARPRPSTAPQERPPERPSSPPRGGGLLRDAAPVVEVPRPELEPEAQTRPRDDANTTPAEPAPDVETDAGTPSERRLRRREGAGGTTGSEVL
ncbi:SH3 domain-containing protein [Salinarimonas rosea]|uniref:SH3 domain-containing protein n=1 Tax=Salinarimonas rosea TaxID=552063 RepID=UPI0006944CEE|nr:SH3 domain-containing protein [Salinarimonas rosea]